MSEHAPPKVLDAGHDYDGIEEFDNKLPNWWLLTLHGAIIFAIAYWAYYQTFDIGPGQLEALAAEMEVADASAKERLANSGGVTDAALTALAADPAAVAAGKAVYQTNCIACHGMKGEGLVGPNLTDAYWIHGGKPTNIHALVAAGKLDKAMPAWEPVLGPKRVGEVVAFVMSMRDTNVAGKAPQGKNAAGEAAPSGAAGAAPPAPTAAEEAPAAADVEADAGPATEG